MNLIKDENSICEDCPHKGLIFTRETRQVLQIRLFRFDGF